MATQRHSSLDAQAREHIVSAALSAPTADSLFTAVSARLSDVVPSDGSGWFGIDPVTVLPSWPVRIENIEPGHCETYWAREFFQTDVLSLRTLADGTHATGALHNSLDGLMSRSVRYREFLAPSGYKDELRSTLRVGGSTWGLLVLLRGDGLAAFSATEIAFVESLSEPLADALRAKLNAGPQRGAEDAGPGVLLFDLLGRLISVNQDARHWMDQLPNSAIAEQMPVVLSTAVANARATEAGRARSAGDVLVQSLTGQWLRIHSSALRDSDGAAQSFAVTITPEDRRGLASILAESYGLSPREVEVTHRLARGESTAAIALALFLSEHTVRDHVKSVLGKTGVSSRAALVARLFFEHTHSTADSTQMHLAVSS